MATDRNPLGVPLGGWHEGERYSPIRGMAIPTQGTAAALVELYKGKSGGRDAETSVIWNRAEKYIHFCSDRGPDVVSVLKRIGDEGILAFIPPLEVGDALLMYVKLGCTRRAWAVVRAVKGPIEDPPDDAEPADACDEREDAEDNEE
jgi:hypothetical protein